ncbi:MAG: transglutaminase [Dehalococcoidia bacterium]|nr:MAG: transglutaminase [Dehalococcoidia bacterium]
MEAITRTIYVCLATILVFSLLLMSCQVAQTTETIYSSAEDVIPRERQGIVTFDITIDTPENADEIRLWLPYPVSNEYQTIEDVIIEGNYDSSGIYREEEKGTISLYAEWNDPISEGYLTYSFNVKRQEIIKKNFPEKEAPIPVDVEKYLVATSLGPTTGPVKEAAEEITKGKTTILGKAMAIYDYIVENGSRDPSIKGCGCGDVEALIINLSGKCADISPVFVTLARSVGIPAREIYGIRIGKEGDITGSFHCRAEFYLPGYGWVPVDPSDVLKFHLKNNCDTSDPDAQRARGYLFGAQTETYIDFYASKDVTLNPAQDGEKLNYFMYPYAEVNGKPLLYENPPHPVTQQGLKYMVAYEEIIGSNPWPW